MGDSLDGSTSTPTPLKKCIECGDEWITDQYEVTCLVTGNPVILVIVDPDPIDEDGPIIVGPACKRDRHALTPENWYVRVKKNGRIDQGCKACRQELNREAKKRQKAKRLRLEAEKLAYLYYEMDNKAGRKPRQPKTMEVS